MSDLVKFQSPMVRWYNQLSNQQSERVALAKVHAVAAGENIRAGGESLMAGAALALVHTTLAQGLDFKKVPLDAAFGTAALIAGVFGAADEFGKDISNVGATCLGVWSFRSVHDFNLKRKGTTAGLIGKASFAGENDGWAAGSRPIRRNNQAPATYAGETVDPVVSAARDL